MTEVSAPPELHSKAELLTTVLKRHGIDLPADPLFDIDATSPRKWLVRGEMNKERLLNPNTRQFTPQSGEWGTSGVFFGDCARSLMYPANGQIMFMKYLD